VRDRGRAYAESAWLGGRAAQRSPATSVGSAQVGSALVEQFPQNGGGSALPLRSSSPREGRSDATKRPAGPSRDAACGAFISARKPAPERSSRLIVLGWVRLQQGFAWREIGKPDVVDVPTAILGLGTPAADGGRSRCEGLPTPCEDSQSDDADVLIRTKRCR